MKKQIQFKKEYVLIAGMVVLLSICYQCAFKKTIEAIQMNRELTSAIAQANNLSYQPQYMQRKSKNLDAILSRFHTDSLALRGNTIALISGIADQERVKLSEVPSEDPLYRNDHFIIQRLDFEGDYFSLLKMFRRLELTGGIGVPRSVVWKSVAKAPGNNSTKKLVLEICFEVSK